MRTLRISLILLTILLRMTPVCPTAQAASDPAPKAPALLGTWVMQGTGPTGLVLQSGRLAVLQIHQIGHTLKVTLRSGGRTYPRPAPMSRLPCASVGTCPRRAWCAFPERCKRAGPASLACGRMDTGTTAASC